MSTTVFYGCCSIAEWFHTVNSLLGTRFREFAARFAAGLRQMPRLCRVIKLVGIPSLFAVWNPSWKQLSVLLNQIDTMTCMIIGRPWRGQIIVTENKQSDAFSFM